MEVIIECDTCGWRGSENELEMIGFLKICPECRTSSFTEVEEDDDDDSL